MKIAKTVWLAHTHLRIRIRSSDAQERHPICRKWLQFMTVLPSHPLLYLEWPENVSQLSPLVEPFDDVGVLKWDAFRFIIRVCNFHLFHGGEVRITWAGERVQV